MLIQEIYNKEMFIDTIEKLHEEYGDKVYNEERCKNELEALMNKDLILCFIYFNKKVIGHISYHKPKPSNSTCSVLSVFTNKEYREKGLGKIMMLTFENYVKKLGLSQIILGARRGREGFYYSCGYNGTALLQVNSIDGSKQDLEDILKESRIEYNEYVFRNNEIHQFYFDTKYLTDNTTLYKAVDSSDDKINLVVVFSKKI